MTGLTTYVPVPYWEWINLATAHRNILAQGGNLTVSFSCAAKDCHKVHQGVVLSLHPEVCRVQVNIIK